MDTWLRLIDFSTFNILQLQNVWQSNRVSINELIILFYVVNYVDYNPWWKPSLINIHVSQPEFKSFKFFVVSSYCEATLYGAATRRTLLSVRGANEGTASFLNLTNATGTKGRCRVGRISRNQNTCRSFGSSDRARCLGHVCVVCFFSPAATRHSATASRTNNGKHVNSKLSTAHAQVCVQFEPEIY